MQSKKHSLIESLINILIGFIISLVSTFLIFPIFEIDSTPSKNVGITLFFTTVSLIRSYTIRRIFNKSKPTI